MFTVCHPPVFLWERLLLTFLELMSSWWQGQAGFVHILHQYLPHYVTHFQLTREWPVSPEGLLPALLFPNTCWSLFSHMGCAGRNSEAMCKACASMRHSEAVGMSVLKLVMTHSAIIWNAPQLLQQRSAVPTVPPSVTLPPGLGMGG